MTLIPILEKGLNRKEMCRLPCFMTTDAKFLSHCLLCDSVQITIITHLNYWNDLISTLNQSLILKAASRIILLNMSNDLSFHYHSIPGLLSHIDLYVVPKTLTTFSSQGLCTSSPLVWSILTLNKFTCLIPTSLSDLCPKATPSSWISLIVLFSHWLLYNSLRCDGLQHARLLCPPLSPGVCSNSCPLSQRFYLTISSSLTLFSGLPSFPVSQLFTSGGQSIGALASATVLPVKCQG